MLTLQHISYALVFIQREPMSVCAFWLSVPIKIGIFNFTNVT